MDKILKKAQELTDEFDSCEELTLLTELKDKIKRDPVLSRRIAEYKKMSVSIEAKKAHGFDVSFDEEMQIGRLYAEIILTDTGGRFLETEKKLFAILNGIYDIIDASQFAVMQKGYLSPGT